MKIEFEVGLISFKTLFFKAENFQEFLIFKSKLFRSVTVDGKKILKKNMFSTEVGNIIISSCIICLLTLGSILKRQSGDSPY